MKAQYPFALMVKPAGSTCNMNCRYCYYIDNNSSNHAVMDEQLLETLIADYFNSSPGPVVSFVWHGGEPMLRGLAFYEKAVELQKKHLPEGWQCWNNLQTNGLLLNDKWCQFLKKEHFDVGISIDGTRTVHDTYRVDKQGDPTYDRIADNIRLLQKHGIQPDLLCTVNNETSLQPLEVYNSLKALNTGWMQFIPVVNKDEEGNVIGESVDSRVYGNFLKCIFNQWLFNDLGRANVQLFAEMLNRYAGGQQSVCWLLEECGRVLVVESDGVVYSCDHFVNGENRIGRIGEDSLADMMNGDKQVSFGHSKAVLPDECLACRYRFFCNGGCPKDRDRENHNYLCEGLKDLFDYADEYMRMAVDLLKQGRKAPEVMKLLREKRDENWGEVSRNSPCPCGSGRRYKQCCGRQR